MTTALEPAADIVQRLINSCRAAHDSFRSAAEVVDDANVKRLFNIYAQQRTRFAEELREHLPGAEGFRPEATEEGRFDEANGRTDIFRRCLEAEKQSLELYDQVLACTRIPRKAHFLVSAQYSLLRRVHDRVRGIFSGAEDGLKERVQV